jgi:uncharacterized protein (TIGR00255 family)
MIQSMTGYGRGESVENGTTAIVELRSVNSRYLEVASRLPRSLSLKENEIKEIVKTKVIRGKISLSVSLQGAQNGKLPLQINAPAAKSYFKLLNELRKSVKMKESVKLSHLLQFSDIFEGDTGKDEDSSEWLAFERALRQALDNLVLMRHNEGRELAKDLVQRLADIDRRLGEIEKISKDRIPEERVRLQERIASMLSDPRIVDAQRLELEIALLADKLDVTEECIRFRSHNKFFLRAIEQDDGAGRKLNFLIQEMNREANTIGSKSNDTGIAYHVVTIKEELEKIREQLQNIE